MYHRYVDDTFMVFKDESHVDRFFGYLNARHPNINFTKELETNNTLNFLDVKVEKTETNDNTKFIFSIFRKGTFTGLGLNFHSYTYLNFKINNIRTLIHRAFTLCSTWKCFHEEIRFLINYFKINGYPENIVFKIINRFLNHKIKPKQQSVSAQKMEFYCKLPFLNNAACSFIKKELGHLFYNAYPHIDFKFLFVNNFSFQGLLSHKEKLPTELISGLVYLYECDACSATYIGQSTKCLKTRVGQHFGVSCRTGSLLVRPPQSSIREHIEICGSSKSLDNFKCLSSFNNNILLRITESMEILSRKPSLNCDNSSYPLLLC